MRELLDGLLLEEALAVTHSSSIIDTPADPVVLVFVVDYQNLLESQGETNRCLDDAHY